VSTMHVQPVCDKVIRKIPDAGIQWCFADFCIDLTSLFNASYGTIKAWLIFDKAWYEHCPSACMRLLGQLTLLWSAPAIETG
jgi:hypothetical protein